MEKINNVIDQLVGIYSERGFLNDEMISKVAFENGVSALMIDKIIEVLDKKGIMISNFDDVVQDSYTVQEKTKKSIINISSTTHTLRNIDKNKQKWYNRSARKKAEKSKKACT